MGHEKTAGGKPQEAPQEVGRILGVPYAEDGGSAQILIKCDC
jgi:hypothetical protein